MWFPGESKMVNGVLNVKKSIDFLKTILDKYKNVDRVTLVNELNDKTLKVKLISKEKINTINQLIWQSTSKT